MSRYLPRPPLAAIDPLDFSTQIEAKKAANEGLRTIFGGEEQTDEEKKISAALEKVAAEHGTESITAIAIACESASIIWQT